MCKLDSYFHRYIFYVDNVFDDKWSFKSEMEIEHNMIGGSENETNQTGSASDDSHSHDNFASEYDAFTNEDT